MNVRDIRAALWTLRALRVVNEALPDGRWEGLEFPRVPRSRNSSEWAVEAVLRQRGATCLAAAIVRQTWLAAHGSPRDLVIGVTAPARGFTAHAWLSGDDPCHNAEYTELLRRPIGER